MGVQLHTLAGIVGSVGIMPRSGRSPARAVPRSPARGAPLTGPRGAPLTGPRCPAHRPAVPVSSETTSRKVRQSHLTWNSAASWKVNRHIRMTDGHEAVNLHVIFLMVTAIRGRCRAPGRTGGARAANGRTGGARAAHGPPGRPSADPRHPFPPEGSGQMVACTLAPQECKYTHRRRILERLPGGVSERGRGVRSRGERPPARGTADYRR